jgi:sugar phosphate isomerase/epimerase
MILSCLPVSYFAELRRGTRSIEDFADEAWRLGLEAIDLSVLLLEQRSQEQLTTLRSRIEGRGLFVNMISSYTDFTHPEADVRSSQGDVLQAAIRMAAALGGRLVRVTAGQAHRGVSREQGIAWAARGLTESLEYAREHGVRLVYENHSRPGVWERYDFSYPTEIFLELVEATEGSELGVNFDTANTLAYGDDPLPVLEAVLERVVSIHAADTKARGRLEPVLLGTGAVPFREIFRRLQRHGFDGPVSIEEASNTGAAGFAAAVEFVRRIWSEEAQR